MKSLFVVVSVILYLYISSNKGFAAEALKAGDKAPYDGILLTIEEDTAIKTDLIELDILKVTYKFQEEKTELFKKAYKEVEEENLKLRKSKSYEKYIFFGAGVLFTGFAVYCAGQLN